MAELQGLGIGLVATPRFQRSLERFGDRLLQRVFTPGEIAYAGRRRNGAQKLAARFAAKCAGRAALAGVLRKPMRLRDLEVVRRRSGEPALVLLGEGAALGLDSPRFAVSLTHDAKFALASVWLERRASAPGARGPASRAPGTR